MLGAEPTRGELGLRRTRHKEEADKARQVLCCSPKQPQLLSITETRGCCGSASPRDAGLGRRISLARVPAAAQRRGAQRAAASSVPAAPSLRFQPRWGRAENKRRRERSTRKRAAAAEPRRDAGAAAAASLWSGRMPDPAAPRHPAHRGRPAPPRKANQGRGSSSWAALVGQTSGMSRNRAFLRRKGRFLRSPRICPSRPVFARPAPVRAELRQRRAPGPPWRWLHRGQPGGCSARSALGWRWPGWRVPHCRTVLAPSPGQKLPRKAPAETQLQSESGRRFHPAQAGAPRDARRAPSLPADTSLAPVTSSLPFTPPSCSKAPRGDGRGTSALCPTGGGRSTLLPPGSPSSSTAAGNHLK